MKYTTSRGLELKVLEDSFLYPYLQDDEITDIYFNGTTLNVQHKKKGRFRAAIQPAKNDVFQLVKKIADVQGKDFTATNPIMDTELAYLRVNAVHDAISEEGVTFAIRNSPPKLVMEGLADVSNKDVEKLLNVLIKIKSNVVVSGMTGSGKTEVQKMLVSQIPNNQKITLIEDTRDSHLKALFPEKDINSWHTLKDFQRELRVTEHELIKAGLRNDPEWILISETRGIEAYDMLEAALTGHSIITTIHANCAGQIPNRLIRMVCKGFRLNETLLGKDIVDVLDIGIHMHVERDRGEVKRSIKEIVEFTDFDESGVHYNFLYKENTKFDEQKNSYTDEVVYGSLSDQLIQRLIDSELLHEVPKIFWKKQI